MKGVSSPFDYEKGKKNLNMGNVLNFLILTGFIFDST